MGWTIAARVLEAILAQARAAAPAECCGVLLGHDHAITDAVAVPNIAGSPNRYQLDPKGHIDARRDARTRGADVVGFYHSHPHSAASPSLTDVEEASYPGHLYLIAGVGPAGQEEIRVYRLDAGNFREEPFVTVP
jgi:proteasome lid subunit RPN8/RPN11